MPRPGVPVFTGQGSALTRAGVWRAGTGRMAVVGLDPHDATHCYRTRGAALEVVQEQLGHATVKTTTIYAGLGPTCIVVARMAHPSEFMRVRLPPPAPILV